MSDKIHKKRKDWPHFDKMYLSSEAYAEGYDRIFGKKEGKNETKGSKRKGRSKKARKND